MNRHHITFFLSIVLLLCSYADAIVAEKHALLIGIGEYGEQGDFLSLPGPGNDLILVENVLRQRFGFRDDDFIILRDAQATHSGIERAFEILIDRVNSNDFVYIHYSGHGSYTPDLNGDEPGGSDQTWVSYGSRTSDSDDKDNYDVLDDEINAWLAALYKKTGQVVFVSDSCHSATVSRGPAMNSRAVKADKRQNPMGTRSYAKPERDPGIRIGAARDGESAIEFQAEDGNIYGVFTWHWMQALQQAGAGATWNDVFKRSYAQVTARRGVVQRPQLEGERGMHVLGGDFSPSAATVPVSDVKEELVRIEGGSLAGITSGSVYRLYAPRTLETEQLPTVTLTDVEAFASYGTPNGEFQPGDLLMETSHAYHFPPVKVYLAADDPEGNDKALLQMLRSVFQDPEQSHGISGYALTDDPYKAELHLYLLRPKQKNVQDMLASRDHILPPSFPDLPPELWVLTPEHRLLYENLRIRFDDGNPEEGLSALRNNLKKLTRIRELRALRSDHAAEMPVVADVYILHPEQSCQEGTNCFLLTEELGLYSRTGPYRLQELGTRTFVKDEILTFVLSNRAERSYYCYLLNISPDGAISTIFPAPEERAEYASVNAGEVRDISEETGLMMALSGEETIKLIASTQPIDMLLLEQSHFQTRSGNLNPLERLLTHAIHGIRGLSVVKDQNASKVNVPNDHWTTEQIVFEVQ